MIIIGGKLSNLKCVFRRSGLCVMAIDKCLPLISTQVNVWVKELVFLEKIVDDVVLPDLPKPTKIGVFCAKYNLFKNICLGTCSKLSVASCILLNYSNKKILKYWCIKLCSFKSLRDNIYYW